MSKIGHFLSRDVWALELDTVNWFKRQGVKLARVLHLTVVGIREDELGLRAAGLTFVSLLTLAPLLAFVFAVYKGMGRGREMMDQITIFVAEMPEQVQNFVQTVLSYVENSSTVGLGGMAVLVLLYAVIKVMSSIEHAFNRVWGIRANRSLTRKVTDYVSILVLVPMLIMAGGALRGFQVTEFWTNQPEAVHLVYGHLLVLGPLVMVWTAFTLLYLFMPNTRVHITSALGAALVAALTWWAWQRFYVASQGWLFAGESKDKVFGAFAAVPIFMFWLYVSWTIVLFGAELAFAIQSHPTYGRERQAGRASPESRILLGIALVMDLAGAMLKSRPPFVIADYVAARRLPRALVLEVLGELEEADLVARLEEEEQYVLLRSPDRVTVKDVVDVLLRHGAGPSSVGVQGLDPMVGMVWGEVNAGLEGAVGDMTFQRMLGQESTPEEAPVPMPREFAPEGS